MDTPYGDIPDRLARDMGPQERHEYLQLSYGRRRLLTGAAVLGADAVAGPVLWREPGPVPAVTGEPAEQAVYRRTLLTGLLPGTTYRYSVSNDGVRWSPDATFTTGHHDGAGFRFTALGTGPAEAMRDGIDPALPVTSWPDRCRPARLRPVAATKDCAAAHAQPTGEVVQYPSTDRCFGLQLAAPFLMQAAPSSSAPFARAFPGQHRVAALSPDQLIPIYQGTR